MTLSLLKSHIAVCLEATMECPFCKDKNIKTALFPEHMGSKHEEECSRLLMEFHRAGNNVKNDLGNSQLKISPFQIGVTGLPRLCKFGRLICGGELGVANKSSGLFGQRPICSVEAGSCGKCMILDKQRLGLQNNCLLNMEGRMCFYDQQKKKVMCGITFTSQFGMAPLACNEINICSSCNLTQQLIAQGVYRAVIIDKWKIYLTFCIFMFKFYLKTLAWVVNIKILQILFEGLIPMTIFHIMLLFLALISSSICTRIWR